ncbi:hypothetical protein GN244_ATG02091 [Phytophthora infestans]|uniref:Secreted RxLR effector peptide protein n=1 Tax=Phytophthora infestans TaxID=4787 RepID=A0A833T9D6_PHYIN|nr:hypothetical protein GN244_ATG02091 [Phytophthora infestans]
MPVKLPRNGFNDFILFSALVLLVCRPPGPVAAFGGNNNRGITLIHSQTTATAALRATERVKSMQLDDGWVANLDDMFTKLKLNAGDNTFLKNLLLETWIASAKNLGIDDPYNFLLLKLKNRYDDEGLAKFIAAAQKDTSTNSIAVQLKAAQLKYWQSKGLTAEDLFSRLKLNVENGDDFLKNPVVTIWDSYARKTGREDSFDFLLLNPERRQCHCKAHQASPISTVKRLDAEKKFSDLGLNAGKEDEFLKNPALSTWVSDDVVGRLLVAVENDEKLSISRAHVEGLLHKKWHQEGKTAEDIFKLLELDKSGNNLFANPFLSNWNSYLRTIDDKDNYKLMLQAVKTQYDDAKFKKMIDQAKNSEFKGNFKGIAILLEKQMRLEKIRAFNPGF